MYLEIAGNFQNECQFFKCTRKLLAILKIIQSCSQIVILLKLNSSISSHRDLF